MAERLGRRVCCAILSSVFILFLIAAASAAQPKADPKRAVCAELEERLTPLVEAQRAIPPALAQIRDDIAALQRGLAGIESEARRLKEADDAAYEHNKEMREEVRGLYVETSRLKGDIAQLGDQLEGLQQDVGNFRFSFGIIAAIIVVLQLVLGWLGLRGRG